MIKHFRHDWVAQALHRFYGLQVTYEDQRKSPGNKHNSNAACVFVLVFFFGFFFTRADEICIQFGFLTNPMGGEGDLSNFEWWLLRPLGGWAYVSRLRLRLQSSESTRWILCSILNIHDTQVSTFFGVYFQSYLVMSVCEIMSALVYQFLLKRLSLVPLSSWLK